MFGNPVCVLNAILRCVELVIGIWVRGTPKIPPDKSGQALGRGTLALINLLHG